MITILGVALVAVSLVALAFAYAFSLDWFQVDAKQQSIDRLTKDRESFASRLGAMAAEKAKLTNALEACEKKKLEALSLIGVLKGDIEDLKEMTAEDKDVLELQREQIGRLTSRVGAVNSQLQRVREAAAEA